MNKTHSTVGLPLLLLLFGSSLLGELDTLARNYFKKAANCNPMGNPTTNECGTTRSVNLYGMVFKVWYGMAFVVGSCLVEVYPT